VTSRDLVSQVVQMLGGDEQRSERISSMRERVAEEATTQMRRMGAKDPTAILRRPPTEAA